jgi:hypothetical protein
MRVIEGGSGTRLTLKSLQCLGVLGDFTRQELERHKAVEACVLGFVDHTHPAAAELFDDVIVGDYLADHGG